MKAVKLKITNNFYGWTEFEEFVFKGTLQECSDYLKQEAIEILSTYDFGTKPHLLLEFTDCELWYNIDDNNDFVNEYKIVDYERD